MPHVQDDLTQLSDPSGLGADALTDVIRAGARQLTKHAILAELATLMSTFSEEGLEGGRSAQPPGTKAQDGCARDQDGDFTRLPVGTGVGVQSVLTDPTPATAEGRPGAP